MRENIIHSDSKKYYSIEVRGPILPTAVHALLGELRGAPARYSATLAHHAPSLAFCYAARHVATGALTTYALTMLSRLTTKSG